MSSPALTPFRAQGNAAAIVFIHGYSGNPLETWGNFPYYLKEQVALINWDIFSVGYKTSFFPDLVGLWSADASLSTLSLLLRTLMETPPLSTYRSIALIAHSMGGLIAQRAILDSNFHTRIGHFILFGTPSLGLKKAIPLRFWKRQFMDMRQGGSFIQKLRADWEQRFPRSLPFELIVVHGENDEFVPSSSSIGPFDLNHQRVVPGNHVSMIAPKASSDLCVQLVTATLQGKAAVLGPLNSARLAVESRNFQQAVALYELYANELDDDTVIQYALALEEVGRHQDAIQILVERCTNSGKTDPIGVLAGRYKRQWKLEHKKHDGEKACELYYDAYQKAVINKDDEQAYYHAINAAFMELAFARNNEAAQIMAYKATEHCLQTPSHYWRSATHGEAELILGSTDSALEHYREALSFTPPPRSLRSMYQQAIWITELRSDSRTEERLASLFQTTSSPIQT